MFSQNQCWSFKFVENYVLTRNESVSASASCTHYSWWIMIDDVYSFVTKCQFERLKVFFSILSRSEFFHINFPTLWLNLNTTPRCIADISIKWSTKKFLFYVDNREIHREKSMNWRVERCAMTDKTKHKSSSIELKSFGCIGRHQKALRR